MNTYATPADATTNALTPCACIEWLFAENNPPFEDRVRAAADAGFTAVEFWLWEEIPGFGPRDLDRIRDAAEATGTTIAAMCTWPFLDLADPQTHEAYLQGVRRSIDAARRVGTRNLITQGGKAVPDRSVEDQTRSMVEVLRRVSELVEEADMTFLLEPLNTKDHPGELIHRTEDGVGIIEAVGHPRIRMLYDRYHSLTMGEGLGEGLDGHVEVVRHYHLANPERRPPESMEVDWAKELGYVAERGYRGYVGLEYLPGDLTTLDTLPYIIDVVDALNRDIRRLSP